MQRLLRHLLNDSDLLLRKAVQSIDQLVDLLVGRVDLALDRALLVVWFRYNPRSAPLCVIYSMRGLLQGDLGSLTTFLIDDHQLPISPRD